MFQRQRFAVHPHRKQGVALINEDLQRGARRPAVGAPGQHHVGACFRPGKGQEFPHRPAKPACIADQVSTHFVGDAGDGDVPFDQGFGQQIGQVQFNLLFHHPANTEYPGFGIDGRDDEGGVDPIEVTVGRDQRLHSVQAHLGTGRDGGRLGDRGRKLQHFAGGADSCCGTSPDRGHNPTHGGGPALAANTCRNVRRSGFPARVFCVPAAPAGRPSWRRRISHPSSSAPASVAASATTAAAGSPGRG
ncbi:hypothetical protein AHiyo4_17110 [Arthrobacter sp. Hiyo4]|nr:hypothetical protein AHiyo4_17110 [Arthrobacter sp. Hiyo4]